MMGNSNSRPRTEAPPPPPSRTTSTPPPPPPAPSPQQSGDSNTSAGLRRQGNAKYASAFGKVDADTQQQRSPVLRIGDAKEALRLYQLATNKAGDAGEWLSAQKNLGMAALRLAEMEAYHERAEPIEVSAQFHTSIMSLTAAFSNADKAGKSQKWRDELEERLHDAVNGLVAYVIDAYSNYSKRYAVLRKTAMECPKGGGPSAALVWRACANEFFKQGVILDESGDWQGCMSCLYEINEPLEHLRISLQQSTDEAYALEDDMQELEKSCDALLAKARSAQHLFVAQQAQQDLLFDAEELDMDLLWFVMDEYKAATRPAADEEADDAAGVGGLETEAIALSAQGVLYQKVLKVPTVAKSLFESSVRIAMAITQTSGGSNFHALQWYKDAVEGLEEIRNEQLAFDLKKVQEQRQPTLDALKPQLDALEAAIKKSSARRPQALNLLKHIYKSHPPKIEGGFELKTGLDYEDNSEMKKALLKAAVHYHPDKPINKSSGIEWYVMCEEITKRVNEYHGYYKEM